MALDALAVVRAEIDASLADFDFDPAPRVIAALQASGFTIAAGLSATSEESE